MTASLSLESVLGKLDAHFESATAECDKEAENHLAWLQQVVVDNKKSLIYQSCVGRLPSCACLPACLPASRLPRAELPT